MGSKTYAQITKDRKRIVMVRLILLIILILFVIWILRPFLKNKNSNKTKDTVNKILNSDHSDLRQQKNVLIIIIFIALITLAFWLLPKLGINFFGLIQKIIPLVSSLRGILPF